MSVFDGAMQVIGQIVVSGQGSSGKTEFAISLFVLTEVIFGRHSPWLNNQYVYIYCIPFTVTSYKADSTSRKQVGLVFLFNKFFLGYLLLPSRHVVVRATVRRDD